MKTAMSKTGRLAEKAKLAKWPNWKIGKKG